ncbi:MAG: ABC transporter permease subunit [Thermoanaerobaculia bacterium]
MKSKMLTAVVKKEVLHQVMSSRFITVTLIMFVLSLLAALVGTEDYSRRSRNYRTHLEHSAQELERTHVYSFLQPVVVRKPEPLSVLDRGFEARLGEEIRIEVSAVPTAANGGSPGNDFIAGSPDFDLTMIVQLVLGLLALLLTFDAVVGEKEAGTLKLVLANDVSRATIVVGKFLGACIALLMPLLVGTALTLGVLAVRAGVVLDALRWQRLGGLVAVYMLYLCLMALIGLLISVWARSTSSSLVLSLLTWLAVVFLIPQTAGALAGDIESADRARQTMREDVRRLEQERGARLRELSVLDPRAAKEKLGDYAPVTLGKNWAERRRYGTAVFYDRLARYYRQSIGVSRHYADRIFEVRWRYRLQQRRAQQRAERLFWLSPAFLMERVAESLAGTSSGDYDEHLAASRAYRTQLIRYLEGREAFSSWRWFTDDPPSPIPWTSLLGLTPEDVDATNVQGLIERFLSKEIQQIVAEQQDRYDRDPLRLLALDDLPPFEDRHPELPRASRRILPELSLLVLMSLALAAATFGR